jgi:predicted membrane-bound mannosyltransferase
MFNPKNIFVSTIIFSILLAGITFRLYNLNIENFWIDEMVTFWVTDPLITINETINRNIESDLHFFFNLILKLYFSIASYEIIFGRYLPAALSIFSILSVYYLSTILKTKNCIFLLFLISFNIYLIKYAQELRSYSLIFFLTSVSLIFFFKITDKNYKKKN